MGFQLVHPAEISRCEVLAHRGKQAKWRDVRAIPEVLEGWLWREQSDSGSCEKNAHRGHRPSRTRGRPLRPLVQCWQARHARFCKNGRLFRTDVQHLTLVRILANIESWGWQGAHAVLGVGVYFARTGTPYWTGNGEAL